MKKYYFNDGTAQQGPFTLEELQSKKITAQTPVWYDGLADWTTAGQVDELKDIIVHNPPPFHAPKAAEEVNPAPAVVTETTAVASTAPAKPIIIKSSKKKTAWLSWVLYLLVFGGAGYFIYQDMEKNKGTINSGPDQTNKQASDTTGAARMNPAETQPANNETNEMVVNLDEAATKPSITTAPATNAETKEELPPAAITNKTTRPVVVNEKAKTTTAPATKTQQTEAQKLAQKKAEEEKKKQQADMAATAAKEKEYRNNWPKYITFGKIDFKTDNDNIEPFNVPVYNATNAMIDKVNIRVDYMKKDKKVVNSETITIYNIPPGTGVNGKASGSKKGNNVKTFITGISSRKIHFCYPHNNGNAEDPYYCN